MVIVIDCGLIRMRMDRRNLKKTMKMVVELYYQLSGGKMDRKS